MATYLLLKHDRGAPAPVNDVPMDRWTPEEVAAHVQFTEDFAVRVEGTGEFVDSQALSPEGAFVRYGGEPVYEWLEVRPFLAAPPTVAE